MSRVYMKWIVLALMLITVGSKSVGQILRVETYRNPDADLSLYSTYYWSVQAERTTDDESYFLNDLVLKSDIRDAIHNELDHLEYRTKQSAPDLLVNFRVFARPVVLKGFNGYGLNYWGPGEFRSYPVEESAELEAGTIIISLIDRRKGELVWQGYATGLMDGEGFIKDEAKVREAVKLVFDQFGQRANTYSKR